MIPRVGERLRGARVIPMGLVCLACLACGDEPVAAPQAAQAVAAAKEATVETKPAKGVAEPVVLADELFVESLQNRDPFHSYLGEVARPTGEVETDLNVLLQEYSLDDLQLMATIAGGTAPRAMFRDPAGMGVIVQRGDHISRAQALVTRILAGKVIVELRRAIGGQKTEITTREIDLNLEGMVQ